MPVTRQMLRLVLVENDPDDLFFLTRALTKEGFTHPLLHFRDGLEALNYFTTLEAPGAVLPHIVLTDLKMPRVDGMDLLQWLRSRPAFKDFPVIILTSSSEASDMRQTARLGIFKFVTKEVRYENVISTLNLFLISLNAEAGRSSR